MPETAHGPAAFGAALPREPRASALARRLVDEQLRDLFGRGVVDDVKTVVSELVNNAFLHGSGVISLELQSLGHCIRIEVSDEGDHADLVVQPGHGLQIVAALSSDWGSDPGTTRVWVELPLEPKSV